MIRDQARVADGHNPGQPRTATARPGGDRVLLIQRQGFDRIFARFPAIMAGLQDRLPGITLTVYWGNVTDLAETVALFQSHRAVIAYHGAGLINTLFMKADALVIELTTTLQPDRVPVGRFAAVAGSSPKLWRTNQMVKSCTDVVWKQYLVPHAQLGVGKDGMEERMAHLPCKKRNANQVLKNVQFVMLTEADLDSIAAAVLQHLSVAGQQRV